jgi:hypothetical protein
MEHSMTLNNNYLTEDHPVSHADNGTGTWAEVATAVRTALVQNAPVVLTVPVGPRDLLQIDIPRQSFEWATPLDQFPAGATGLTVASHPAADPSPSLGNLDGLLWALGNNAFNGTRATWLDEAQRVRLARWPNLPKHMHSMKQMYMLAVLGNAYFTAAELAAAVKGTEAEAHNLINALSLMRLLKYSSEAPAFIIPAPVAEAAPQPSQGLFARLLARLGR